LKGSNTVIILSTEGIVPFARRADFLALNDRFAQLVQQQPGFQAASLVNSLGTPSKFIGTTRFESLQAAMNWINSTALATFLQQNPLEGIMTPTRPTEAAETVIFERNQGNLGFVSLVEVTIDFKPGNVQAFESRCQELMKLWQQHGKGVVLTALTRSLNGGGRYTIGWGHVTREDAQATLATPQIVQFMEKNHLSNFSSTAPVITQTQVVRAVVAQPTGVR
jgi:quinol monooxygenase YgiN